MIIKKNMQIGFRVPSDLISALSMRVKERGQKKTAYLVELIRKDLNIKSSSTLSARVDELDRRLTVIEAKLNL